MVVKIARFVAANHWTAGGLGLLELPSRTVWILIDLYISECYLLSQQAYLFSKNKSLL